LLNRDHFLELEIQTNSLIEHGLNPHASEPVQMLPEPGEDVYARTTDVEGCAILLINYVDIWPVWHSRDAGEIERPNPSEHKLAPREATDRSPNSGATVRSDMKSAAKPPSPRSTGRFATPVANSLHQVWLRVLAAAAK